MSEDDVRDLGFCSPAARAGDRHAVADPHAGVPGEYQVRLRVDDVVPRVQQAEHRSPAAGELAARQAQDEQLGEVFGREAVKVAPQLPAKLVPEPRITQDGVGCLPPGPLVFQGVLEELGDVENRHSVAAKRRGEAVVLLLGPLGPRQCRDQQPARLLWRDAPQLRPWPVDQDRPQRPDLAVHAVELGHRSPRTYVSMRAGRAVPDDHHPLTAYVAIIHVRHPAQRDMATSMGDYASRADAATRLPVPPYRSGSSAQTVVSPSASRTSQRSDSRSTIPRPRPPSAQPTGSVTVGLGGPPPSGT